MVLIQQIGKHGEAKQVPFVHPPHSNLGIQLDMEILYASWGQRQLGKRQSLLFVRFTGCSFNTPPAPLTEVHRPQGCGGTRDGTTPRRCPISKPPGWSAWTETPLPRGQPFRVDTGWRLGGFGNCHTASLGDGIQKDIYRLAFISTESPFLPPPQLAPRDARNPLPPDLINPPSQPLQKLLYHPSSQITPSQLNGSLPSKTPSHDHNPFNINRYRPPHTNHHRHRHYHHHNKPPRSSSHDPQHKGPPGVPQGRDRHTYIRTLSSGEGPGRAPIPLPGVILSESISTHDPVPRPVNVAGRDMHGKRTAIIRCLARRRVAA